jgi:hypothetical protein
MRTKQDFIDLLVAFVDGTINSNEFERNYIKYFLKENSFESGQTYDILSKVFWDIEDYVEDDDLRDDDELDTESLRDRCRVNLRALMGDNTMS